MNVWLSYIRCLNCYNCFTYTTINVRGESLANVGNLARNFKNEVGTPLLNSVRQDLGLQVSGLQGLPPELLLRVFQSLNLKGVMALSRVSKHLRDIHKLDNIWRKLCEWQIWSPPHYQRFFSKDEENIYKLNIKTYLQPVVKKFFLTNPVPTCLHNSVEIGLFIGISIDFLP